MCLPKQFRFPPPSRRPLDLPTADEKKQLYKQPPLGILRLRHRRLTNKGCINEKMKIGCFAADGIRKAALYSCHQSIKCIVEYTSELVYSTMRLIVFSRSIL